jgi:hypothetical protein
MAVVLAPHVLELLEQGSLRCCRSQGEMVVLEMLGHAGEQEKVILSCCSRRMSRVAHGMHPRVPMLVPCPTTWNCCMGSMWWP